MADRAPAWVVPVMRAGYGARGLVYTVVGGLALLAAWQGGSAQGTTNALADLKSQSWGVAVLWIIALGLFCYSVWRFIAAYMDLDDHGHDAKGTIARIGQITTGLIHGALGVAVASIAMGGSSGGGDKAQSLTARALALPYGALLLGAIALCVIGAGIYYIHKGVTEKYKEHLRVNSKTRTLDPAMKAGFVAEGIVVGFIGASLLYAAYTADPAQAKGLGEVLGTVRSMAFGRILMGLLALGLLCFAIQNFIEAAYRILPRRDGPDVKSLATAAKAKAKAKARQAT